jgi:predicted urease superfamily metal-dependent hydrolase
MDRKNIVIGGCLLTIGLLAFELSRLAQDFKTLHKELEEKKEAFEMAKNIVTEYKFAEIVEGLEED